MATFDSVSAFCMRQLATCLCSWSKRAARAGAQPERAVSSMMKALNNLASSVKSVMKRALL